MCRGDKKRKTQGEEWRGKEKVIKDLRRIQSKRDTEKVKNVIEKEV